jgi:hypothetical protein
MRVSSFLFGGVLVLIAFVTIRSQNARSFESAETARVLGIKVTGFEGAQGVSTFQEIDPTWQALKLTTRSRPLTGPTPLPNYEQRKSIQAKAPDGTIYYGLAGRFGEGRVLPGPGGDSTNQNPRQMYATHLGYGFNPADVFIGKFQNNKIKTALFFRDIGSHETAPFHFTIDSKGNVHLIVADVNISANNELNVFSLTGDPRTGKWTDAVLLDRRGFTSSSHPWSATSGETIHLMWNWGDATYDVMNPGMGLFYIDWANGKYGQKLRVISGLIETYSAAVDSKTGKLLVVARVGEIVYVTLRAADGTWRKAIELSPKIASLLYDLSVHAAGDGSFIVRGSGSGRLEWVLRPQ